jgi:ATP-dependent helicase/nuclease subunit A
MPAEEVYPDEEESVRGEIVLVQGVIDCIFLEEDGWVLLDYKTDAVSVHGLERTASRYELQLRLYARAIERIWRQPVKEAFLYFFDGGRVVKVPLTDNQGEAGR